MNGRGDPVGCRNVLIRDDIQGGGGSIAECPEAVVQWHDPVPVTIRHRCRQWGAGGVTIESQFPIPNGSWGRCVRSLPTGTVVDRGVMVVASRPTGARWIMELVWLK